MAVMFASVGVAVVALSGVQQVSDVVSWEFESAADLEAWAPNGHLANVSIKDGRLCADAVDWDPSFACRSIEFEANALQFVLIRIRADRAGQCDLFWSGSFEGKHGGLSEEKKVRFSLNGNGDWEEKVLFPFWHSERTIRQLRLDVYEDVHVEIDRILVAERRVGEGDAEGSWDLREDWDGWEVWPGVSERFAPGDGVGVGDRGWCTVRLASQEEGVGCVLWAGERIRGLQSEWFPIRGDGELHSYNVELAELPGWSGTVAAFGLRLPEGAGVQVDSVALGSVPMGSAELEVTEFGFVNAPNRAGKPCEVRVRVANRGRVGEIDGVQLSVPNALRIVAEPARTSSKGIGYGEHEDFVWELEAVSPGKHIVQFAFTGTDAPGSAATELEFSQALGLAEVAYVPAPQRVKTTVDVCAYYFPGWNSPAKWDCIRDVAPIRKPTLGYYDEGNPEVVDWQIKWAVENGISCFLVDWYWSKGGQHLTHWFEAYRGARYRDELDVAIMWANHNAPGSHSVEDWRAVTREWVDNYFGLPSYYQIDGKPAVFIWAPGNIRRDLGGSEVVRACFNESQEMARAGGHDGITFVAMMFGFGSGDVDAAIEEGYWGATSYHEWGASVDVGPIPERRRFADIAATVEEVWKRKDGAAKDLVYLPVVDTGWDSRPWHGEKSLVIGGRTPELFRNLLRKGKAYCETNGKDILVLGPLNEWGEGSYIEPNTEFGFMMYESVREVFGKGGRDAWPVNVAPADVGLGPYGYPPAKKVSKWTFEDGPEGWAAMMNVRDFRVENGALRFRTVSGDPAIMVGLSGTPAGGFSTIEVKMAFEGGIPEGRQGQIFWSAGGRGMSEATSVVFPLVGGETEKLYRVKVGENARWRGNISTVRFDPCNVEGVEVVIKRIELKP